MERMVCGGDSEIKYPSNHYFIKSSFSFCGLKGNLCSRGMVTEPVSGAGSSPRLGGKQRGAVQRQALKKAGGLSSDGIILFAQMASSILEPSPKFRSLVSCF